MTNKKTKTTGGEDTFLEGALGAMVIGLPLATGNVNSSTVFDTYSIRFAEKHKQS